MRKITKKDVDLAINSVGGYFKCKSCEYGLEISAAALITAAIAGFPEDSEVIAELAEAVGLNEEIVAEIIKEVLDDSISEAVSKAIKKLCHKMGAC